MATATITEAEVFHSAHTSKYGIATVAGVPYDPSGDNGPATLASIGMQAIAFRDGLLYLTDGARIRRIAADGTITTVAGKLDPVLHQPIPGFSGDGGPALGAQLRGAAALEFDSQGNLYIADLGNSCVRKVTARVVGGAAQPIDGTETITTVAGTGTMAGNSGDGGLATAAQLRAPRGLAVDMGSGALYIADQSNNNIRVVNAAGTITTLAGSGATGFLDGPAATAMFNFPTGVTVDPGMGDVYVGDVLNSRIRKITAGTVTTFAGTGTSSASGNLNEGGPAIAANIRPVKVRFIGGILYLVDSGVGMIRLINVGTGIITTLSGSGLATYTGPFPPVGDGGPALGGLLGSGPNGVQDSAFDAAGNVFIADASSRRVRFVANAAAPASIFGQTVAAGTIATVAGPPGIVTFSGDGNPATSARLFSGAGLVCDHHGNLYVADNGNNRVREISPEKGSTPRTINTIAGNGTAGYSGVPGPAIAARIQPGGLALHSGDLYVTNNATRILEISGGSVTLIANTTGASTPPPADGTPAVNAHIGAASIVFDHLGNMYAGDSLNNRIWKIDSSGNITSIAGGGTAVLDGVTVQSATATQVKLFGPASIAFDPLGNLYTIDGIQNRILQITARAPLQPLDGTETVTIFAGTGQQGFAGDGGPANEALLNGPGGLIFDTRGRLYFSDGVNFRIRRVGTNGVITTIAGTGTASFSGDGGPSLAAEIRGGQLAFDLHGNLFLMDSVNNVIRVLDDEPPVVRFEDPLPAPNGHGWHNTTVAIPFTASDSGAGVASTNPSSPLVLTAEGTAVSGTVTATDRAGNTASSISWPVKIDKQGPVISGMPTAGLSLSPPDGRMVHVATITAADDLSGVVPGSLHVTGTSNEPPDSGQISIHPNSHGEFEVWLQAARSTSGSGRVYTLTAEAMDHADNVTTVSAVCLVPK